MATITFVPTAGVSSDDREAWHEQRRQGVTATQVRDLASGRGGVRRKIMIEKLTGEHDDLTGNKYIDRGNAREDHIAAWIEENFDLLPSRRVFAGENPRHLATPDGISADIVNDRLTAEVKTSKHDLDPLLSDRTALGALSGGTVTPSVKRSGHFWTTGYYDQIQWQMHVMGGQLALFVWEQHDDNWPDPANLYPEPRWVWVQRDQKRIDELVGIADDFLDDLDHARPGDIAPVGDMEPDLAAAVHELLLARDAEAVAKAQREKAWKQVQALTDGLTDFRASNSEASVSVTTSVRDAEKLDEVKMRERAPRLVAQYEALVKRYTKVVPGEPKVTLSVTAAKAKK